ncbi:hypothetical protein CQW23_14767 [Capsicum baccatum]|uniref:Serine-threonine/tyrosine-protein kinase catalytic domain-containing protein n=1 Tax=Capsicum baccatum TaxID=33114 RepID=A0A2G2WKA9_CAPBA|nr:hypothetical protein CQW23_14767 [Capsicum baccatum]
MYIANIKNFVISTLYLRRVTYFVTENELDRGGVGLVYKGVTEDASQITVKRMESDIINHKALDEFLIEIDILSKVQRRHLVSLVGYTIEGTSPFSFARVLMTPKDHKLIHADIYTWSGRNMSPTNFRLLKAKLKYGSNKVVIMSSDNEDSLLTLTVENCNATAALELMPLNLWCNIRESTIAQMRQYA